MKHNRASGDFYPELILAAILGFEGNSYRPSQEPLYFILKKFLFPNTLAGSALLELVPVGFSFPLSTCLFISLAQEI